MRLLRTMNADIVIYCVKVFLGIMLLLSIVAIYESVQSLNVEKYKTNTPLLDTRAQPSDTGMFLRNEYRNGVKPVEIKDPGRFLGTDLNQTTFAVDVTTTDVEDPQQQAKLQVFDVGSNKVRHETYASGCSNVSPSNVVYCHNGQRTHLTAFHVFTGKSMFSFPTPDPEAHFSLLGSNQQADLVVARNTDDGPATTNTVYAITGNQVRWSKKLHPNERCNVIDQNRTLLCHQPGGGAPGAVDIRTMRVSDGMDIAQHHSAAQVSITSTGWIEHPADAGETNDNEQQPRNTDNYRVFDIRGNQQGTSRNAGPDALFPFHTDGALGNATTLTYPAHAIAGLEPNDAAIVAANGTIAYHASAGDPADKHQYFALDGGEEKFSFAAQDMLTCSRDGTLLLVRTTDDSPAHAVKYQIFDTTNKNSMDIIETPDSVVQVINGTVAITHQAESSDAYGKLTVFLPDT